MSDNCAPCALWEQSLLWGNWRSNTESYAWHKCCKNLDDLYLLIVGQVPTKALIRQKAVPFPLHILAFQRYHSEYNNKQYIYAL